MFGFVQQRKMIFSFSLQHFYTFINNNLYIILDYQKLLKKHLSIDQQSVQNVVIVQNDSIEVLGVIHAKSGGFNLTIV